MKKKAFTLIELIAVLVILAILALIVTPLVMNIIRKARISADKRSIDAYGRSIELAIANYLLDNGDFPTDVSQLTIQYTGDEVVCSTTQLNSDSSVYLAGCTVGGRSVDYTYGKEENVTYDAYEVGDEVTYNNVNYRVIKDSGTSESTVTLLKVEPLTYEEIQTYSAGTGSAISNQDGYGKMQYHSRNNNYDTSYIKSTLDAWAIAMIESSDLVEDSTGYSIRLLTIEDLVNNLGMEFTTPDPSTMRVVETEDAPAWLFSNYWYWTMSPCDDISYLVWFVSDSGLTLSGPRSNENIKYSYFVRPVITLKKSSLN